MDTPSAAAGGTEERSAVRVCDLLRRASDRLRDAGCPEPVRDAELLAMCAFGWSRERLLSDWQGEVTDGATARFRSLVARREAREPLSHIRGTKEFWGLDFRVTSDVLIPRPETEMLVEQAIRIAPPGSVAADIGTGAGAIAVSVAASRPDVRLVATDISEAALAVARANARTHAVDSRVSFVCASLASPFADASLDLVAANLPYVCEEDRESLMPEVRQYEPAGALFAGSDGLSVYRQFIPQAARCVKPDGVLILEFGAGQDRAVFGLIDSSLWEEPELLRDMRGIERAVVVRRRGRGRGPGSG